MGLKYAENYSSNYGVAFGYDAQVDNIAIGHSIKDYEQTEFSFKETVPLADLLNNSGAYKDLMVQSQGLHIPDPIVIGYTLKEEIEDNCDNCFWFYMDDNPELVCDEDIPTGQGICNNKRCKDYKSTHFNSYVCDNHLKIDHAYN